MSERIDESPLRKFERYGFIIASIAQVCAIIWWISALNSTVSNQKTITNNLNSKVQILTEKTIRIEEKLNAFEKDIDTNTRILLRIEDNIK